MVRYECIDGELVVVLGTASEERRVVLADISSWAPSAQQLLVVHLGRAVALARYADQRQGRRTSSACTAGLVRASVQRVLQAAAAGTEPDARDLGAPHLRAAATLGRTLFAMRDETLTGLVLVEVDCAVAGLDELGCAAASTAGGVARPLWSMLAQV